MDCETGVISNAISHVIFSPFFFNYINIFHEEFLACSINVYKYKQIIMYVITPVKIFLFIYINNNYAQSFGIS